MTDLKYYVPEVATVSLGSVEAGVCGGEVSCGLALIPVVVAEAEAAKAIAKAVVGEEVGPGEAAGSSDFVRRRCKLHPHSHFHLPLLRSPRILAYGSDKLGSVRQRPPGGLSTAWHRPRDRPFSRRGVSAAQTGVTAIRHRRNYIPWALSEAKRQKRASSASPLRARHPSISAPLTGAHKPRASSARHHERARQSSSGGGDAEKFHPGKYPLPYFKIVSSIFFIHYIWKICIFLKTYIILSRFSWKISLIKVTKETLLINNFIFYYDISNCICLSKK